MLPTKFSRFLSIEANQLVNFTNQRIRVTFYLYILVTVLHGVLDPGISYIGIEILGIGEEANPLLRAAVDQGLVEFMLIHIPLYAILLFAYVVTIVLLQQNVQNNSDTIYNFVSVGLMALIAWGVWINIRNLLVLIQTTG